MSRHNIATVKPLVIFDQSRTADRLEWRTLVENECNNEPMMRPEYLGLLLHETSETGLCALYAGKGGGIVYPFILRELIALPYCPPELTGYRDVTTPYGYGGPYIYGEVSDEDIKGFWDALHLWSREHLVVTEFVRFALELGRPRAPYPGRLIVKNKNIARGLDSSLSEIWMDSEHKVRKNVNRARRNGLTVERDSEGRRMREFLEIYRSTMARRGAKSFYSFDPSLFSRLNCSLKGCYQYFFTLQDGHAISTELILYSKDIAYSFLGGTDESAYHHRPNDLLKFEIIKWALESGLKWYVLGGGYQPNDGIFKYKKSFAPHGEVPFYVGERILDPIAYDGMMNARRKYEEREGYDWEPVSGHFPSYRA